jgi:hypothetical protein
VRAAIAHDSADRGPREAAGYWAVGARALKRARRARLDTGAVLELLKAPCHHIERRSGGPRDGDNFVGDVLADRAGIDLLSRRAISASSAFKLKSTMVPIPVEDVDTSQRARTMRWLAADEKRRLPLSADQSRPCVTGATNTGWAGVSGVDLGR